MDPRQRIGKYTILGLLGTGGMGAVYKAVDPHLGRTVALKVLAPGLQQNAELRERFLREARAAGSLQHPNIVVIHDLGEEAGELYIAMEFLEGETLAEALARRIALPAAEAVDLLAQVARGLHYAHQRNVIHRDVKPHNIMVTRDGLAKVVDFGIARAGDQRLTKTGQVMGTVFYMSPEQINGKPLDGRSDVFSAGVVLYEMVTGKVPFEGESTGATMMKIIMEPPAPLRTLSPLSPPELESVVMTALAKQPDERYPSAAAFAKALEGIARGFAAGAPTLIGQDRPAQTMPTQSMGAQTMPAQSMGVQTMPAQSPASGGYSRDVTTPGSPAAYGFVTPDRQSPGTRPAPAMRKWWTSTTLKYSLTLLFAVLLGGGWWALRPAGNGGETSTSMPVGVQASAQPSPTPNHPVPTVPTPKLEGTYDLFQDNEVVGEMTVYNQSESEFAVRAKEWDAQGHISGREGYYDWRFAKGELAGQTGRTTFTVQEDGNLVGKVQGDRPELKWAYLAKPRVRPAAPLAAAGPAADEAQPSWLEGTWTGVAHQQQNNSDWSVRLVASGSSYKVSYPSLGCSGYLSVYEITSSTGRFLERITSGLDKCVDGVTITLTRVSATQIRYQAHGTDISVADLKKE